MPQTVKNPLRKASTREVTGGRGTVVDHGRGTVDRGRGTVGGRGKRGPARGGITQAHDRPGTSRIGAPGSGSKRKAVLPEDVGGGSGSQHRTSYPPQNPLHRHPLPLVNQSPPLQVSDEEMHNSDEEEDYYIGLELEDEEEDEVDAPNAEDQEFDQLLDNLLRLSGRE
ncbi:hypothetical protein AALP_AA6G248000 [Arabis alpina]|uniref:Uncharacterized protein n=1 Tax=Arabis alpina TaxID=50452 RepID=A0A087GRH9_ARAAL|nr:hypothetical protein AALP_AA6G248000 [Arabis alpina]